MSAEEAKEFLADLPEESAPTASAPAKAGGAEGAKVEAKNEQDFNKAMKSHGAAQVPVGSDDDQADPDSADATVNLARQYGMGVPRQSQVIGITTQKEPHHADDISPRSDPWRSSL